MYQDLAIKPWPSRSSTRSKATVDNVGTQFVLPSLVTKHGKSDLTPEREKAAVGW
jgi:hypothetical protein